MYEVSRLTASKLCTDGLVKSIFEPNACVNYPLTPKFLHKFLKPLLLEGENKRRKERTIPVQFVVNFIRL
jgi:hypothetical protein